MDPEKIENREGRYMKYNFLFYKNVNIFEDWLKEREFGGGKLLCMNNSPGGR